MSTVYRLWCKNQIQPDIGFWSGSWKDTFLDRKSAQKYCDKANADPYKGIVTYEVAKDNGDNGPSFFDVNDPEPVSAIPPSSEDCWPPFSGPYDDEEPCPDTERSSQATPAPEAKRFVTVEDLAREVQPRANFSGHWFIGPTTIHVEHGSISLNGNRLTTKQALEIREALVLALRATAA